ncbi:hypothetical protein [Salipaludibacillus daqingensis]|uniref:hypothetical protein n=1 Tax=Salipaludibacillus daqingensis TaxID=3041001 RepID=UPI0024749488|nr:hypothetical protein [Salipaludibacillus daqingensis]
MISLNEEIREVKEKIRKHTKWNEHLGRLEESLQLNEKEVQSLENELMLEKEDVEKLHSFSLANVFSTIAGNKQEKMDERKKEVVKAKLKYQEAYQTLKELKAEHDEYQFSVNQLGDVERDYHSLINRKEELIHNETSLWSQQLFDITEQEAELAGQIEEVQEALDAGEIAQNALNKASASFDKAKGWSTFDLFGGGIITTAIKHSHLDTAKETVHHAERRLRQFQDELLDIKNHMKVDLNIGELLTFADYFFDGIIVNWMVHDKISDAANQIEATNSLVNKTIYQLQKKQKEMFEKLNDLSIKRIKMIEKA